MDLPCYYRDDNEKRGRHLRATRFIAKNELVFCERPLLSLQSVGNAHSGALVCRNCRAFVGGPDLCIGVASDRVDRADVYQHWTRTTLPEGHELNPCRHGCGEVYCCTDCEQDHWYCGGHSLLCTGLLPETCENDEIHALVQFKIHAVQNNEIFIMVADMIATVLCQRIRQLDDDTQKFDKDQLLEPYLDFTLVPWWTGATAPLFESPEGAAELEKVLKRICQESSSLLRRAFDENPSAKRALQDFPDLCTMEFFGKVIGSFEQNAIGIRQRHPNRQVVFDEEFRLRNRIDLLQCMKHAGMIGDDEQEEDITKEIEASIEKNMNPGPDRALDGETGKEHDKHIGHDDQELDYSDDEIAGFLAGFEINDGEEWNSSVGQSNKEMDDLHGDDLDALFHPLDGTAMYSEGCKMNHSCDPNIVVLYRSSGWGREHPLVAHFVALCDIEPGEELCISYIQSDKPLDVRQAALANYGFTCSCTKCKSESIELPDEPEKSQIVSEFDDEDLFGDDDESDEHEKDSHQIPNSNEETSDGETALQQRRKALDRLRNLAPEGAVPLKALALASNFVVQVGTSALEQFAKASNASFGETIRRALGALKGRDYVLCKSMGSQLEKDLFQFLWNRGSWPHAFYREAHSCGAVVGAIGDAHEGSFLPAQQLLDKASILGLPRNRVENFFAYVEHHANTAARAPQLPAVFCQLPDCRTTHLGTLLSDKALSSPITSPIHELHNHIEQDEFDQEYLSLSKPVVFRRFAEEWPAVTKWRNMDILVRDHGHRLVPIEVGSMMESGKGMKEQVMNIRDFVVSFLKPSCERGIWALEDSTEDSHDVAYLAQHPLLDQIPQLLDDVQKSPTLCGKHGPTHINVWIGTGGTRTPLHFDSYDNLFVQVVGAKYVRIYGIEETKNLYVIRDCTSSSKYAQGNMSRVNCEEEDFESHPMARDAKYVEVLMLPGDCLFIPARAWHYVRSLSTSVSVNYWF